MEKGWWLMGCSSGLWGYFPAIQPTGSPRKNRESFQQNRAPFLSLHAAMEADFRCGLDALSPDVEWAAPASCSGGMLHESDVF